MIEYYYGTAKSAASVYYVKVLSEFVHKKTSLIKDKARQIFWNFLICKLCIYGLILETSHCIKYARIWVFTKPILQFTDRIYDSVLIQENTGQWEPVFSHVSCNVTVWNTEILATFLMLKFCVNTVSAKFQTIHPKFCGSCNFPQNLHTRRLGEITVFYVVEESYNRL